MAIELETQQAEGDLAAARQRLEAHKAEVQDVQRAIQKKELELKTIEQEIQRLTLQLTSVKTNREYQALQHEIGGRKAGASMIEDESLRMMLQADEARCLEADLKRRLEEAGAAGQARRQDIAAQQAQIDHEVELLRQRAREHAARLSAPHHELYERLRTKSNGLAVAAARGGACEGCFMHLTSNTINHLMNAQELVRCHSCGRILYLDEEE